jgi:hypothetical protein
MNEMMEVVHIAKKGRMLDTLENFMYTGKQNAAISLTTN